MKVPRPCRTQLNDWMFGPTMRHVICLLGLVSTVDSAGDATLIADGQKFEVTDKSCTLILTKNKKTTIKFCVNILTPPYRIQILLHGGAEDMHLDTVTDKCTYFNYTAPFPSIGQFNVSDKSKTEKSYKCAVKFLGDSSNAPASHMWRNLFITVAVILLIVVVYKCVFKMCIRKKHSREVSREDSSENGDIELKSTPSDLQDEIISSGSSVDNPSPEGIGSSSTMKSAKEEVLSTSTYNSKSTASDRSKYS